MDDGMVENTYKARTLYASFYGTECPSTINEPSFCKSPAHRRRQWLWLLPYVIYTDAVVVLGHTLGPWG